MLINKLSNAHKSCYAAVVDLENVEDQPRIDLFKELFHCSNWPCPCRVDFHSQHGAWSPNEKRYDASKVNVDYGAYRKQGRIP